MIQMLDDWSDIKGWLNGEGRVIEDISDTHYKLVHTVQEVDDYFHRYLSSKAGVDTESHNGTPFSIQVSLHQGTGIMVPLDAQKYRSGTALAALGYWLIDRGELIFHNAEADIDIVNKLVNGEKFRYRDTISEAYNLGNLPQGLKALGYRLLGIRMQSWQDLVSPYSRQALIDWINVAIMLEQGRPIYTPRTRVKTCSCVRYDLYTKTGKERKKPKIIAATDCLACLGAGKVTVQSLDSKPNDTEKLLARVLKHMTANAEYDPWQRLQDVQIPELAGPQYSMPVMGIDHVPTVEAVEYGCRDADVTLRLANELDRLRGQAQSQWGVLPEDCDEAYSSSHP